jgi:hypothetical protein
MSSAVAYVQTELGDRDTVFNWLPRSGHSWEDPNVFPNLVTLRIEPMWDPLHLTPDSTN